MTNNPNSGASAWLGWTMGFVIALSVASAPATAETQEGATELPTYVIERFGSPPDIPTGPLNPEIAAAMQMAFVESITRSTWGADQNTALESLIAAGDPRVVWPISDMMRFINSPGLTAILADAASQLLGITYTDGNYWGDTTDHLMAWRIPAPPGYLDIKRTIFTTIVPGWDRLFVEGDIDWRHVSWGGVQIDNRAFGETDAPCNCIPAADNPEVTDVGGADWLEDDDIVFGVEVNGEHRAYPRRIMEVREMVNDTLGGRDLSIPYCTLCGAAQAYFTDDLLDGMTRPVLRTSGLLIRSNKVMYDITTHSVFDTFLGTAVTGPLHEKGYALSQASVVTSTWGAWKDAHPDTTVLAEHLALGRDFDFRNGRDADGPIFPIGDTDPRLPVHEDIVGVVNANGTAIAFQRSNAVAALARGENIEHAGVELVLDGDGVKALSTDGKDLGSHQAFWFAWSQFHPDTQLWPL